MRLELELGVAPISNLWDVIERRGADLATQNFGPKGGDGLYLWNGSRGLIVVNSSKSKGALRRRFTAAHELGHHEMHRFDGDNFLAADADIFAEATAREKEANSFAANLLAPVPAVRAAVEGKSGAELNALDVVKLSRTFGLSYAALLWRLQNSTCISSDDRVRLKREASGRMRELREAIAFDEESWFPLPRALPEEFTFGAAALYQEGVVDEERLAQLLRLPRPQARALAQATPRKQPVPALSDTEIDKLLGG